MSSVRLGSNRATVGVGAVRKQSESFGRVTSYGSGARFLAHNPAAVCLKWEVRRMAAGEWVLCGQYRCDCADEAVNRAKENHPESRVFMVRNLNQVRAAVEVFAV